MSQQRIALKNPTGWFAAGREVARAMALLSDGAFKVYMHVCLTADRSTGRMKVVHTDIATALKKSRRSVVTYLEELREHQICSIEAARNQHAAGHIEVCDPFWPYVKYRGDQDRDKTLGLVRGSHSSVACRPQMCDAGFQSCRRETGRATVPGTR